MLQSPKNQATLRLEDSPNPVTGKEEAEKEGKQGQSSNDEGQEEDMSDDSDDDDADNISTISTDEFFAVSVLNMLII